MLKSYNVSGRSLAFKRSDIVLYIFFLCLKKFFCGRVIIPILRRNNIVTKYILCTKLKRKFYCHKYMVGGWSFKVCIKNIFPWNWLHKRVNCSLPTFTHPHHTLPAILTSMNHEWNLQTIRNWVAFSLNYTFNSITIWWGYSLVMGRLLPKFRFCVLCIACNWNLCIHFSS